MITSKALKICYRHSMDTSDHHWESFYLEDKTPNSPSLFAVFVKSWLDQNNYPNPSQTLFIDLGAGSGRDSVYFAQHGSFVIAIDGERHALQNLTSKFRVAQVEDNLRVLQHYFTEETAELNLEPSHFSCKYRLRVFYSRFFLHSINSKVEDELLKFVSKQLTENDLACFEFRVEDSITLKYEFEEHYRRLINFKKFQENVENLGLIVLFSDISRDFAPYLDENPLVGRIFFGIKKHVD